MGQEVLQKIVDLHYYLDDPRNPLFGIPRLKSGEPIPLSAPTGDEALQCKNCVAACCFLSPLIDLTAKELGILTGHGTIPMKIATRKNTTGEVQAVMEPKVMLTQSREETLKYGQGIIGGLTEVIGDGYESITILGPCGCLNSRGGCTIHGQEGYPISCGFFKPNSGRCSYAFIERGSDAGIELQRLVNLALPKLNMIANNFVGNSRGVRTFNINDPAPY